MAFILAAIVGIIGDIQGNAGSVYILTGLLFMGIVKSQAEAVGTTLVYTSIPLTLGAAYTYYKDGKVDVKISSVLVITGLIFSTLGAYLSRYISEKTKLHSTGILLLISSIYFMYRGFQSKY